MGLLPLLDVRNDLTVDKGSERSPQQLVGLVVERAPHWRHAIIRSGRPSTGRLLGRRMQRPGFAPRGRAGIRESRVGRSATVAEEPLDGTRSRLLTEGASLFRERGFNATTTR